MAGDHGAYIQVQPIITVGEFDNVEQVLYSESPGRFIVTVAQDDRDKFESHMLGIPCSKIGIVSDEQKITIRHVDKSYEHIMLNYVKYHFQKPLSFGLQEMKA